MLDGPLTRQEKMLIIILRWWMILFTVALAGFIFFSDRLLEILAIAGDGIFKWRWGMILPSEDYFWLVLTVSLMSVLIYSAYKAQSDIIKNICYVNVIIISKIASTVGFIVALIFSVHAFAYLVGAIVDGSIFLITIFAYRSALRSRYGS